MKILVSIDGSEHSEVALAETCRFPWRAGSQVTIVSVVDDPFGLGASQKNMDAANALVTDAVERVRKTCNALSAVEGSVLKGNAKTEILKAAESKNCDLLIVGSRGRKGIQRVLLGSVSHTLLMATPCSVRIARKRKSESDNKRVMLCLDDSDSSAMVVRETAKRPWQANTEFLCVSAIPTMAQMVQEDQNAHLAHEVGQARAARYDTIKTMMRATTRSLMAQIPNSNAQYQIIDGDARETIVEKAREWDAALILIGSKGKALLDRVMVGSVSEAVATWAECSVEVVKREQS